MSVKIVYEDKDFKHLLPIVATSEFLNSKSNSYGWFIDDDFILPFIVEKKFIFKRIIFTYSVIKRDSHKINQKDFLNSVVELSKTLDIDFIYQPYAFAIFEEIPDNSIYIKFGTYKVDLTRTEDELFLNLHTKHRNVVRKAMKNKLEVFNGLEHIDECFKLIEDTLTRQKQPFMGFDAIQNMSDNLKGNIAFYIVKNGANIEGSAIVIYNELEAYYIFAGSGVKTSAGAMNLLVWQIICDMKSKGVLSLDFVGARLNPQKGSKFEGIQRFKSRFGSTLKEGYLWKFSLKPFKYKMFRFITWLYYKLTNKTYMGDIIDQELKNV